MMIAVVLSSNIRRMTRENVLVRKSVGLEAAGSMDLLFTDKTGTLTEGQMSVSTLFLADGTLFDSPAHMYKRCHRLGERLSLCCRLNSSATDAEGVALGGNATDRALARAVSGLPKPVGVRRGAYLPFDSTRKYSLASLLGAERLLLAKGAAERLLPYVRFCYTADGRVVPFSPHSHAFSSALLAHARAGERVLLLCEGEGEAVPDGMRSLTLLCAVVLSDRLRRTARSSVQALSRAGVHVVMITGDSKETAAHIAAQCGILDGTHSIALSGDELSAMSDEQVKRILPSLAVVARSLPSDKSRLVRLGQEAGAVVGMTGDGINDAPALKRADVGFAMGGGTQVAKDAGDVIILDNDLSSIVRAVLYGRNIFKSIRKFITLQLTMNFCAVGVSMIAPFLGFDAPVTVVQMLWINLIMDTLGGLAFAGEAASEYCMREKPKKRDERILNRYMIHQILLLGSFTVGLCLLFLKSPAITSHFRPAEDRIYLLTAFFVLFIFSSVHLCFAARTDRLWPLAGLRKNRPFVLIMSAVCITQLVFVYVGGKVLRTAPLLPEELGYTLLLSLLVIPAEFLRKLLWRRRHKDGF